jgi:predicted aconitase with swiveling domain
VNGQEIEGRCLVPGHASGEVLFSDVPLSFWMGIDTETGEIIDRHHPLCGEVVTGKIFVLPGARGSCSGSCGLLELIHNDKAPAALVFAEDEAILTLGAMIAGEIFGKTIPIAAVDPSASRKLAEPETLTVDNGRVCFGRLNSKHEVPASRAARQPHRSRPGHAGRCRGQGPPGRDADHHPLRRGAGRHRADRRRSGAYRLLLLHRPGRPRFRRADLRLGR